jgi:hypothetical protein
MNDYFMEGRACPVGVIPGWSEGPDPESRDSGFDASHRPGMTGGTLQNLPGIRVDRNNFQA